MATNAPASPSKAVTVQELREKHGLSLVGRVNFESNSGSTSGRKAKENDKATIELLMRITDSTESQMLEALMQLNKFISDIRPSSVEASNALRMIWNCDVYNVLLLYLRTDFHYVKGGWDSGVILCTLLSRLAVLLSGILPMSDMRFFKDGLNDTVDRLLECANKVYEHVNRQTTLRETQKVTKLQEIYNQILESVFEVVSANPDVTHRALTSSLFLNVVVADAPQLVVATFSFLARLLRIQRDILLRVDQDSILSIILDELMYHIGSSNSTDVGAVVLRCAVQMCEQHSHCIELINNRYKGIRLIVCRWFGKGFQRDLQRFISLIEAGTAERALHDRVTRAVIKIQATWRMYATKKRLERAGTALGRFQRAFRNRREVMDKAKMEERIRKEFTFEQNLRRNRQIRRLAEEELQQYEHFSADEVRKFVANRQQTAAKMIQTRYRGYKERERFSNDRMKLKEWKAAIVIQRAARRWIDRLHYKRSEPPAYQRPPGLTEARREEIQRDILDWRSIHPPKARNYEELREFHTDSQQRCFMFLAGSKQRRRKEQEFEATLRRLEADSNLLMSAPKIGDIDKLVGPDLDSLVLKFQSRVLPIATRARQLHNEQLRRLQAPAWQQLCVDPDNDDLDLLGEMTNEERKLTQITEINLL